MSALTDRYAPRSLRAVYGQPAIVESLRQWLHAPHSKAFLFSGETGTGKTATGRALAHELGCSVDDGELGGLWSVPSGSQGAEEVRTLLDSLYVRPMLGTGWRVALVNEADSMTKSAETIWLDALDEIERGSPPRSVIVFSTNKPDKLSQRFKDRCELHTFTSAAPALKDSIRRACVQIWRAEGLDGEPPNVERYGINGATASFRAAYRSLELAIRQAKSARPALVMVG